MESTESKVDGDHQINVDVDVPKPIDPLPFAIRERIMELTENKVDGDLQINVDVNVPKPTDPLPFARSYQLEALEKAMKQNTIVFLETGSGKTLIAIMLLRSYAYLLRKPSPFFAVFLVPQVVLVQQQAEALKTHTDLKVGMFYGAMETDLWDINKWKHEQGQYEVFVMTPAVLLNALRHSFFKMEMIKVLIFDECHHASGDHAYAGIMREFYHPDLGSELPRIFGMTASPIKSKGSTSARAYWKKIHQLENILNSKVYTCASESALAKFIPFSTPKMEIFKHIDIPCDLFQRLEDELKILKEKHEDALNQMDLKEIVAESANKKLTKLFKTFLFCIKELGVWLAYMAAESLSCGETDIWGNLDISGEKIIKDFSKEAAKVLSTCLPSDTEWSIGENLQADMDAGFLSSKVISLIESILKYRDVEDLRCIIFVQRVITSIVIQNLLSVMLPRLSRWKTQYIAGSNSGFRTQTRKRQNEIVEEFRKGMVNIIVATSILEEGLDVQSCNLVIRFDPSATVCSFIQSRGRARMRNSEFLLMVRSGDSATISRVKNYLVCGDIMRKESLRHASVPCEPLGKDLYGGQSYIVKSTGAKVTLSSSVCLIYFYCSRLPSDGYFKPSPICRIDKETKICTLLLPKSCPIQTVRVQGKLRTLKQLACLEACKQLHKVGALTDYLVPDILVEEAGLQDSGAEPYDDEQPGYFPPEMVNRCLDNTATIYHCYLIKLNQDFNYNIQLHDVVLLMRTELEPEIISVSFDLEGNRGKVTVHTEYAGVIHLTPEQVDSLVFFA